MSSFLKSWTSNLVHGGKKVTKVKTIITGTMNKLTDE